MTQPPTQAPVAILSVMNHVTVINPTEGIFVTARPPVMNHVAVFNSAANGFTFDGFLQGDYILTDCSVSNSKGKGFYFRSSVPLYNASFQLNACNVEHNIEEGIYVESNANLTVVATNIRNNSKSGCSFAGRGNSRSYVPGIIIFEGNKVLENRMEGIKTMGAANMSVKKNDFSGNGISTTNTYSTFRIDQFGYVDIEICNNTFNDNMNYYNYYSTRYSTSFTVYVGSGYNAKLQVSPELKRSGGVTQPSPSQPFSHRRQNQRDNHNCYCHSYCHHCHLHHHIPDTHHHHHHCHNHDDR